MHSDSQNGIRPSTPRSPKRNGTEHPVHINWFPYYAGYNSSFVYDVLNALEIQPGDTILDPWNGSGTTTSTAYRMGAKVIGCDINPVMVVAAKGALLDPGTAASLVPLAEEILNLSATLPLPQSDDPLCIWYTPSSALNLRRIHHSIWKVLVESDTPPSCQAADISEVSTLAAFFLTALLRTTRSFLTPFIGSNPTWIREPASLHRRVRPPQAILFERYREEVAAMTARLESASVHGLHRHCNGLAPTITVAPSQSLPFETGSVDAIVSSPPYLTRIDYAVATKPELAALGMSLSDEFNSLRRAMLGAPAIRQAAHERPCFNASCDTFLKSVQSHPSKGSANYYYKLFVQYFSDMDHSLSEASRLLADRGACVLVVQDSYYKELHADLALFVTELAEQHGLTMFNRNDYEWSRNMVRVNSRARKYRASAVAVESALWFRKR